MHLSQLTLNPCSRAVRQDLADCHELHRTLLCAFPQAPEGVAGAREHFGLLYRVESDRRGVHVLAQSAAKPDWAHLPPDYLLPPEDGRDNPAVKPIDEALRRIAPEMQLIFRLRANPTRKIETKSGPDGKRRNGRRVALTREEDWTAWLQRKADQSGFALLTVQARAEDDLTNRAAAAFGGGTSRREPVPDVRAIPDQKVTGRKGEAHQPGPKPHRLTFGAVLFEGRLRVIDAERFRATVETGIGSGKAYGFGLLSVAPA